MSNVWCVFSSRPAEETTDRDVLCYLVTGVLNKISQRNYDAMWPQVLGSNLGPRCEHDPGVLTTVVSLLHSKAMNEKPWLRVYARLCRDICRHWEGLPFSAQFSEELCRRCLEEMARGVHLSSGDAKPRRRTLANMAFVGELYGQGLVTPAMLHEEVLVPLLTGADMRLEMFAEVMGVVGKQLDGMPSLLHVITAYFHNVAALAASPDQPMRVRCKLWNLLDLRRNNWGHAPVGGTVVGRLHPLRM